jgi:excinuclease ABC subunit C
MIALRPRPAAELRADVRAGCENRPGVYRMIGPGDDVLYVGRSVRMRSRLLSYFRAPRGEKAAEIMSHTHRIDWQYAPSEFAMQLAEMRAIQRWRPPYNVEHKRDRAFCFVKLTRESAPRLLPTLEVADDGALYFGPFRGRARVREALREVSDLLELRTCASSTPMRFADQLDLFGADPQPLCMRADVRKCLAPCAARCTRVEYLERAEQARRFLEGDVDLPLRLLGERMRVAAERMQFEYAARLRDRAVRLADARSELLALRGTIESLSFIYHVPGWHGDDRVYLVRRGSIRAERAAPRAEPERRALLREARRVFGRREHGAASVHAGQVAEILLVARWFRLRPGELERTWQPAAASGADPAGAVLAPDAAGHAG